MRHVAAAFIFLICAPYVFGQAAPTISAKLEEGYFATLDKWVERGGPIVEVQGTVIETCGKLVMATASASERLSLTTTRREDFHFRVDVCAKITVNRVHPQPEFEKKRLP